MRKLPLAAIGLLWASSAHASPVAKAQPSDFFFWRPTADAVGWVVFLPGSGGIRVLDDDHHYFDVADRLNRRGWSVLVVDYKSAYRASGVKLNGTTGEKIAWAAEEAATWMRRMHPAVSTLPGALVGWSLGAEGVLTIANDGKKATALGIAAAVVYYPSNQNRLRMNNQVPIMILSGQADDVTRSKDVEALVRDRSSMASPVELHLYPGAHHAFDVASLTRRKTLRLLPLVGPKATLQYDEASAVDAEQRLLAFLADNVLHRPR